MVIALMEKRFEALEVGDQLTAVAEIMDIRYDGEHTPPKWVLYTLNDGTTSIRVFGTERLDLEIGDIVQVEFEVRLGKEYKNKPQLAFRLHILLKLALTDPRRKAYLERRPQITYLPILRKAELRGHADGTLVKLFTHIITLHPPNSEREKVQKVLIADAEEHPISLWLTKAQLPLLEQIKKDQFLLKAVVKTVQQNKDARYLLFQTVVRGQEAFRDPLVRQFMGARLKYHAEVFRADLDLWKKFELGSKEDLYVLNLTLAGLIKDAEQVNSPKIETVIRDCATKTKHFEDIKFTCYECNKKIIVKVRDTDDIPKQCPQCHVRWSSFSNNFHYEILRKGTDGKPPL